MAIVTEPYPPLDDNPGFALAAHGRHPPAEAAWRRAYKVMHRIQASGYDAWVVPAGNEEWYARVC